MERRRVRLWRSAPHVMLSSEDNIHADALDRQSGPAAPTAAERRGLALALIAAAALHVIVPLALFAYNALWPAAPIAVAKEIPVEVVLEAPPPKPKKAEEKPKPPPAPEDEKPAYDAPRAATPEKVNRNSKDDKTQAPAARAEPPLDPGAPPKSEARAAPAQAHPAQAAAPPPDLNGRKLTSRSLRPRRLPRPMLRRRPKSRRRKPPLNPRPRRRPKRRPARRCRRSRNCRNISSPGRPRSCRWWAETPNPGISQSYMG